MGGSRDLRASGLTPWSLVALAGLLILGALLVLTGVDTSSNSAKLALTPALFVAIPVAAYLAWRLEPAWLLTAGLVLSPVAGNWSQLGIPGTVAPDRLLLIAGVASVFLRPELLPDRRPLRLAPVHWLMLIAVAYIAVRAVDVGLLFETDAFAQLWDSFGIAPFLVFLVAPVAFRYRYQRDILLVALVALGAYLGITAFLERMDANALIFPGYITDPNYGFHFDRSRGPFVEAVTNGFALFMCSVACAIAAKQWRGTPRGDLSVLIGLVCVGGMVLTMQRSVWLAAGAATVVTVATMGAGQRIALKTLMATVVGLVIAIAVVPGLHADIQERLDDDRTVHDRENLSRAAVGMIEDRPLLGFGWQQFPFGALRYFEQAPDYPLGAVAGSQVHSTILTYGAELGLIGLGLWAMILVLGIGPGLSRDGPRDVDDWRVGLVAVATAYLVITNFVPPQVFPNLALWAWAGIAWVGFQGPADRIGD